MTPIDPNQTLVEAQYRSLLIIWASMLIAVGGFLLMTILVPSKAQPEDKILPIALTAVGFANVVLSFILKKSFLAKSVAQQDLKLVQQAYIVALALCESAALFGLLIHFITGSVYYYAAFAIALIGMLLHFPMKQHLLDASFKRM
jgi:F0F1-type ATP synthase membrane subunit c/vacuolar-type H+-ATPase subunit K